MKYLERLISVVCFMYVCYALHEAGYRKGHYDSCIDTYSSWYKRLGIKDIDQDSLEKFCKEKAGWGK